MRLGTASERWFSPLRGFLTKADYERVCHSLRLSRGILWPIRVTLDVREGFVKSLNSKNTKIALRDAEGVMLAVLHVEDVWQPDRQVEAAEVYGRTSTVHSGR